MAGFIKYFNFRKTRLKTFSQKGSLNIQICIIPFLRPSTTEPPGIPIEEVSINSQQGLEKAVPGIPGIPDLDSIMQREKPKMKVSFKDNLPKRYISWYLLIHSKVSWNYEI